MLLFNTALMVKWISRRSSEPLLGVRIPLSAQKILIPMKQKINNSKIPKYVTHVTSIIENAGFEAFLVGGCVRDLLIDREPKDWDITTNAKPEEIIPLFEKTIYENNFGTVGVCIPKEENTFKKEDDVTCETLNGDVTHVTSNENQDINTNQNKEKYYIVEVTPYRIEAKYEDFRHPKEIKFSDKIKDDLKRRDFTINAMAYNISKGQLIDLYKGQENIKDKVIKAVDTPEERFQEDALRMLRAVRFSTQLDFAVSYETMKAISDNANLIKNISKERIREEFIKIIDSPQSAVGIGMLSKLGLLKYIIPELEEGIGCEQGGAHIFDVFEHCLKALEHATSKGFSIELRLASLFHDIGKPRSRRKGIKKAFTFYGHEVVGARMVRNIMDRLKFPKKQSELVVSMVRNHMFFSDTEQITLSAVRRVVQKVGKDHIWDLMNIREADRVGMKKKEAPYRLRKYHAMIDEVLHDPISVSQLAIDGNYLMQMELHPPNEDGRTGIKPGPRIGWILNALLEEVLDDPKKNTEERLSELVSSLNMLGDKELRILGERGKEKKDKLEEEEVKKLHMKHGV